VASVPTASGRSNTINFFTGLHLSQGRPIGGGLERNAISEVDAAAEARDSPVVGSKIVSP